MCFSVVKLAGACSVQMRIRRPGRSCPSPSAGCFPRDVPIIVEIGGAALLALSAAGWGCLIPREESNAMNRTTEAAQVLNQRRPLRAFKHQRDIAQILCSPALKLSLAINRVLECLGLDQGSGNLCTRIPAVS